MDFLFGIVFSVVENQTTTDLWQAGTEVQLQKGVLNSHMNWQLPCCNKSWAATLHASALDDNVHCGRKSVRKLWRKGHQIIYEENDTVLWSWKFHHVSHSWWIKSDQHRVNISTYPMVQYDPIDLLPWQNCLHDCYSLTNAIIYFLNDFLFETGSLYL